jgi:phosphoribosylanthranilate isomerase
MWIKICGIATVEDARMVASFEPDAIGLVFYPGSARFVDVDRARIIADALPAAIRKVGVFVDPDWDGIGNLARTVPLDLIQWHGGDLTSEGLEFLNRMGIPWIDVRKIHPGETLPKDISTRGGASYLLIEGASDRSPGGNRVQWDRSVMKGVRCPSPLILSGGLDPENVFDALRAVCPFGVDVSSGVETRPGKKDPGLLEAFFSEVRRYGASFQDAVR